MNFEIFLFQILGFKKINSLKDIMILNIFLVKKSWLACAFATKTFG